MKVLLTGASGNIGGSALSLLLAQGHTVRCLLRKSEANERKARTFPVQVDVIWGDIGQSTEVLAAVRDQDVIVHLAAIIPPLSEKDITASYRVNVEGTRVLLEAARQQARAPKFLYSSTFNVFGETQHLLPPRRVADPIEGTDAYSEQKILAEELVRTSGLEWAIYRFSDVPPLAPRQADPLIFRIPLNNRIETLHTLDAGLAVANGISRPIWGKIWLIGGGSQCQVLYGEYISRVLEPTGIGMLPEAAFSKQAYHSDWMDTSDSQGLLDYQHHTFDQIIAEQIEISRPKGVLKWLMPVLRPLIRQSMLKLSPYIGKEQESNKALNVV